MGKRARQFIFAAALATVFFVAGAANAAAAGDDDTTEQTLILDDGTAEDGLEGPVIGDILVQGFVPPHYPARLVAASWYVDTDGGLDNPVRVDVFYAASGKGMPSSTTPVYRSDPMSAGDADAWNDLDLSDVAELAAWIESGEFYIGFEYTVASGQGPFIGVDYEGEPNEDAWFWDPKSAAWHSIFGPGFTGVLMWRPTVEWTSGGDDDDNDDQSPDDDASPTSDDDAADDDGSPPDDDDDAVDDDASPRAAGGGNQHSGCGC
jgi:hypothetical protein